MKFFLWAISLFGWVGKIKVWMQGKKTYLVNVVQALAGLGAMIALLGQFLDLAGKTITLLLGWSAGGDGAQSAVDAVQKLWMNHAVLTAGFAAAFYSVTDACSKMASYAASQRQLADLTAGLPVAGATTTINPPEVK